MGIVGSSEVRVDAFDKATGRTKYYDDLAPKEALLVRIKHSTIAHGFVKSIDKTEAEKIVRHFEKIRTHYAEKQQNKTALSVAVTDSIIVRLPIKLQRLFINGNDNFVVSLVETYSKPCADAVAESEADFAVIYGRFRDDVLEYRTLDNVQQVIIVNKDHTLAGKREVSLAELSGQPFVAPDKYSWPRIVMAKLFEEHGAKLDIVYECNRPRQTIDLVANNPKLVARTIEPEITAADLESVSVLRL